jgi:formate-nitrite transporter family protein
MSALPVQASPALLTPPVSERDHAVGPADARVTLVEYGDFECPSCGAMYLVIKQAERAFGSNLRVVFRHFPLRASHPHALQAAVAAEAAAEQGQFWAMHDRLFEHQTALGDEHLLHHARKLGLDTERFRASLAAPAHGERVRDDLTSGAQSGVRGTPTLFINGMRYDGPTDRRSLVDALARAALTTARPGPRLGAESDG